MTLELALDYTVRILCVLMTIQSLEMLWLINRKKIFSIWSFQNLQQDLLSAIPLKSSIVHFLFSEKTFSTMLLLQLLIILSALISANFYIFLVLFIFHLITCIRFRGTFNGGSDMMTFVVLIGLLISFSHSSPHAAKLGLTYIAINGFWSYVKAGLSKLQEKDWRSGQAVSVFLQRSLYSICRKAGKELGSSKWFGLFASWATIIFEVAMIALLFKPGLANSFMILALLFHFSVHLIFGLNRFFWAWLAVWPSMIYFLTSTSVKHFMLISN